MLEEKERHLKTGEELKKERSSLKSCQEDFHLKTREMDEKSDAFQKGMEAFQRFKVLYI